MGHPNCVWVKLLAQQTVQFHEQFPELGSRVSAGFFASTAGVVGQRAQVALWSMGVHLPLGAHGAFAAVLGMAAGSAVRVRASRSRVLLVCLCASLVPHCG